MARALSNPEYLKIDSTGESFSLEERCSLPMCSSLDPAYRRHHCQLMNVFVIEGIDAAGMAFAAHFVNLLHHGEGALESGILEDRQHGREFLAGEKMLLADVLLLDDEKLLAVGNSEAGDFGDLCRDRKSTRL